MAFVNQSSPGVNVREIDLTNFVPSVGTSGGAFTGKFTWGPVLDYTIISDSNELARVFGKPTDDNYEDWFSVSNFLSYTGECNVVRVTHYNGSQSTAFNAVAKNVGQTSGVTINNDSDFSSNFGISSSYQGKYFAARYPGKIGNSLEVIVVDKRSWNELDNTFKAVFEGAPGTSDYVKKLGGVDDEVHVLVIDKGGLFSGIPGSILEKYSYLSKAIDAKGLDGSPIFFGSVINKNSQYIRYLGSDYETNIVSHGYYIVSATVDSSIGGTGYAVNDIITLTAPATTGGIPAKVKVTAVDANGMITAVEIVEEGTGYQQNQTVVGVSITTTNGSGADLSKISATLSSRPTTQWGLPILEPGTGVPSKYTTMNHKFQSAFYGGDDGGDLDPGDLMKGWAMFRNSEEVDVSLLFLGSAGGEQNHTTVVKYVIENIAEHRKDCVVFFSPKKSDVVNQSQEIAVENIIRTRNLIGSSSSYAIMDSGWQLQYDIYNDKYRWVPCNADVAGICAEVDYKLDPWWSPAGFNRGRLKNAISIAFNPNQTYRDELYKNNINPIVSFKGNGIVLFGDKTLQAKDSAFQHINVRRLFIVLEKAISRAARYQLFEFNDQFTRAQFKNMVEPYLREVRGRRGIIDYMVVCDETNNTPEIIDRGQFIASIFIKPSHSINYITLNFVATRTGINFNEIIGGGL